MAAVSAALSLVLVGGAGAASHREAPLISLDPPADITDFFMFRSYEPGHENNVVLILSYVGGADGLPPITALDGPGSEGLCLRQRYSVTQRCSDV
jgi:hypothetical protein